MIFSNKIVHGHRAGIDFLEEDLGVEILEEEIHLARCFRRYALIVVRRAKYPSDQVVIGRYIVMTVLKSKEVEAESLDLKKGEDSYNLWEIVGIITGKLWIS